MAQPTPFGRPMRDHFQFSPSYMPLNHGSFGTFPKPVCTALRAYQAQAEAAPDTFIFFTYDPLLYKSRLAIASLVNVPVEEIVFVPNATTGINTVLRGMQWEAGDVIVYFEVVYGAVGKTVAYITETTKAESERIEAHWPIEDAEVVKRLENTVTRINTAGDGKRRVRMAIFDTVVSMPGIRLPFEDLTAKCKELDILSMIDGAHGIGHIPLDLGKLQPDFFVSNLHKWLFLPRGVCALYIPIRNQGLIRSSLPTSHNFIPHPRSAHAHGNPFPRNRQPAFNAMFDFVGTIDNTNYLCVPAALAFRRDICGGEEAIVAANIRLARAGGDRAAAVLGTEVLDGAGSGMRECAFANVRLPLEVGDGEGPVREADTGLVTQWLARTGSEEFDTYLATVFYGGSFWWRLSAQVYLEVEDLVWGAKVLVGLCERVRKGEHVQVGGATV